MTNKQFNYLPIPVEGIDLSTIKPDQGVPLLAVDSNQNYQPVQLDANGRIKAVCPECKREHVI